jgi:hypothetical protein
MAISTATLRICDDHPIAKASEERLSGESVAFFFRTIASRPRVLLTPEVRSCSPRKIANLSEKSTIHDGSALQLHEIQAIACIAGRFYRLGMGLEKYTSVFGKSTRHPHAVQGFCISALFSQRPKNDMTHEQYS